MSRRSSPEHIHAAHQAATRQRLIGQGVTPETADAWIEAWAVQAARDSLERDAAYWEGGWEWIAAERQRAAKP